MITIRSFPRAVMVAAALMLGLGSVPAQSDIDPSPDAETLSLHLDSHSTYFEHSNHGSPIIQKIAKPKSCLISVAGPLATLTGSDKGPGMKDASIGIRTGSAEGTPCSRVDSTEDLTLSLGDVPQAVSVALDLELKGGVQANLVLSSAGVPVGTFQVRSGSGIVPGEGTDGSSTKPYTATATTAAPIANCLNGPSNSGTYDNCHLTILPDSSFDAVTFQPLSGELSLEGGGDYGSHKSKDFETVFTLVDYDGELGCEEDNNSVVIEEGTVFGDITRLQNTDGSECVVKPYNIDADVEADTLSFVPHENPGAPQPSAYQATLMFAPEPATFPLSSLLEYDQDDGGALPFVTMPWCAGDPFAASPTPGSIDVSVIPAGHTWCVVQSTTSMVSATEMRTTWSVVGVGDPKFR